MKIYIPIGLGDLADRYSIVRLKMVNMSKFNAHNADIRNEFNFFQELMDEHFAEASPEMQDLSRSIAGVNGVIWEYENQMRETTRITDEIINVAFRIRDLNDKRAKLKRKLNQLGGHGFLDHKVYR
jgi:hypothetical protein